MNNNNTVAIAKCSTYDQADLRKAIDQLLANLGGLSAFVKPGQNVLIKPNLLTDRTPDEATTTHPEAIRAIIRMLKEQNITPVVADSPSSAVKLELVWEKTGFKSMCREENVELVNLEQAGSSEFQTGRFRFNIAKPVLDANAIINVPKVKTHAFTTLTAAVKNMYGVVPGYQKANLHKLHPTMPDFGKLIAEIYRKVSPVLTIADAVIGMDGDGPSGGNPINLGFLAASGNAVALDLALCRIFKIKPESIYYLKYLLKDNPLCIKELIIKTTDINIESIRPAQFNLPSTILARLIPGPLVKLFGPLIWVRPVITDKCISCGRCVNACAMKALSMQSKQKPVLEAKKCIGCCCCHEVCPEKAIKMTQSPLLNIARRGKML